MVLGLFKPPSWQIEKYLPVHALMEFKAVESYAEMELENISDRYRGLAVAIVLSIWACNSALAGKFQISKKHYDFILMAGTSAEKRIPQADSIKMRHLLNGLIQKGLIPHASNPS